MVLLFGALQAGAQVPYGFHPRHCLSLESLYEEDMEAGMVQGSSGTGPAMYFLQLSRDRESGELKASCATPGIEIEYKPDESSPQKKHHISSAGVSLIPNPAKDAVIVRNGFQSAVYIFDYTGRQVLFQQLGAEVRIDLTSLSCGIYSVKVEKNGVVHNLQLMIQR